MAEPIQDHDPLLLPQIHRVACHSRRPAPRPQQLGAARGVVRDWRTGRPAGDHNSGRCALETVVASPALQVRPRHCPSAQPDGEVLVHAAGDDGQARRPSLAAKLDGQPVKASREG